MVHHARGGDRSKSLKPAERFVRIHRNRLVARNDRSRQAAGDGTQAVATLLK